VTLYCNPLHSVTYYRQEDSFTRLLPVYLLYVKTTDGIFVKILPEMYMDKKELINFRQSSASGSGCRHF